MHSSEWCHRSAGVKGDKEAINKSCGGEKGSAGTREGEEQDGGIALYLLSRRGWGANGLYSG